MGNLTNNFSEHEFRCPCCSEIGLDRRLLPALQKFRDLLGRPVIITSGCRCLTHNASLGSHRASTHVFERGPIFVVGTKAADVKVSGLNLSEMLHAAEQIPEFAEGGIGIYPNEGFLHLDVRRGKARWGRVRGEYVAWLAARIAMHEAEGAPTPRAPRHPLPPR